MKSKTIIEVNGRRYDAITGAVIGTASAPIARHGRNIDGFFRGRPAASARPQASATEPAAPAADAITILSAPKTPGPTSHRQPGRTVNHARAHTPQVAITVPVHQRSSAVTVQKLTVHHSSAAVNHTKRHQAQNSTTLRREGVERPVPSFHKQAGTQGTLQHSVPSLIVPKQSVANVDTERLARAQSIARSSRIAHHSDDIPQLVQPAVVPLAVQPAPTVKPGDEEPAAPAPPPSKDPDIFEHALMNATHFVDTHAHVKHHKKQVHRHLVSMAAGTLALVIIAAFATYQNVPSLQFRVASLQAGVATNMPDFKAAGFNYTTARAKNGKLTLGFSNAQNTYQLTQQATNLSDSDMIQTVAATDASGNPNYITLTVNGTAVYRFTNTDATWVSDGTWYTVNGTGPLSDQQVASLVKNV